MSELILNDYDDLYKTNTKVSFIDGKMIVEHAEDIEAMIKANKQAQTERQISKNMKHLADLPFHLYIELKNNGTLDDKRKLRAWLDDPDNRFFRRY